MGGRRIGELEWGSITTFRRDGTWWARGQFRHENGVLTPHDKSGKTERAARMALKRQFVSWAAGDEQPLTSRSKVADAVERHLEWVAHEIDAGRRSPGTLRTYRSVWSNHLEPRVRGWRLTDIHVENIDRLLRAISKDAGEQTAKTCRVLLGAGLKEAVRTRALPHNPMSDARPTPTPRRADPKAMTREQVALLRERLALDPLAHRDDVIDPILWMLCTSERIGNCLAAAWSRIDLREGEAQLGPNIIRVPGLGLVERDADVSSKTRSRTVVLPGVALEMLHRRQLDQSLGARWVFPSPAGDRPRDPSNTSRAIKAAMGRAGFGWVTSHVFRKTVATALDDAGIQTRIVSDYLGHAKTTQTSSDYFRRRADAPRLRSTLDDFLGAEPEALSPVADLGVRRAASTTSVSV